MDSKDNDTSYNTRNDTSGRQINFGLREHQCCKLLNGSEGVLIQELEKALQEECSRCRYIPACVDWALSHSLMGNNHVTVKTIYGGNLAILNGDDTSNVVRLQCWKRGEAVKLNDYDVDRGYGNWYYRPSNSRCRVLPSKTSSRSTIRFIQEQLSDCESSHGKCSTDGSIDSTRDLGNIRFLCVLNNKIRLVSGVTPSRYACLSHCWGNDQHVTRTTRSCVGVFTSSGVPLESLPKTFRDAIRICRKLGIDHIWIDSLCIIQDDVSDWQEQAALMSDVFKNAYLTIAASKSKDSREGCFSKVGQASRGQLLPGYNEIFVRCIPPTPVDQTSEQVLESWPLLNRAWVFQEILLSRRIVHFGVNEIWWQCKSTLLQQGTIVPGYTRLITAALPYTEEESTAAQWHTLVAAYSERSLTLTKDRLPAIAAIARQMSDTRKDDIYLAGVWKKTLLLDLAWSVVDLRDELDPGLAHHCYSLPTWSWARLDGRKISWDGEYDSDAQLSNVRILEAECQTKGSPFTGILLNATIVLEAAVIRLDTLRQGADPRHGNQAIETNQSTYRAITGNSSELMATTVRWDRPSETDPRSHAEVLVLPLSRIGEQYRKYPWNLAAIVALLIRRVDYRYTTKNDTRFSRYGREFYERLGTLELTLTGEWSACRSYDEEQGDIVTADRHEYWATLLKRIEDLKTQVVQLV